LNSLRCVWQRERKEEVERTPALSRKALLLRCVWERERQREITSVGEREKVWEREKVCGREREGGEEDVCGSWTRCLLKKTRSLSKRHGTNWRGGTKRCPTSSSSSCTTRPIHSQQKLQNLTPKMYVQRNVCAENLTLKQWAILHGSVTPGISVSRFFTWYSFKISQVS